KGGSGSDMLSYEYSYWNPVQASDSLIFDIGAGRVRKGQTTTSGGVNFNPQTDDIFSSIESFQGGSGKNTFISAPGSFFFHGAFDAVQNTLDYSWDKQNLNVDLSQGTAD